MSWNGGGTSYPVKGWIVDDASPPPVNVTFLREEGNTGVHTHAGYSDLPLIEDTEGWQDPGPDMAVGESLHDAAPVRL